MEGTPVSCLFDVAQDVAKTLIFTPLSLDLPSFLSFALVSKSSYHFLITSNYYKKYMVPGEGDGIKSSRVLLEALSSRHFDLFRFLFEALTLHKYPEVRPFDRILGRCIRYDNWDLFLFAIKASGRIPSPNDEEMREEVELSPNHDLVKRFSAFMEERSLTFVEPWHYEKLIRWNAFRNDDYHSLDEIYQRVPREGRVEWLIGDGSNSCGTALPPI